MCAEFAPPEHAEQAKKLIEEVVGAMLCLSDALRKREYDRKLGRPEEGQPRRRTMEQVLLDRNAISPAELTMAKNFALAVGFELHDALIQRRLAPQEVIVMAYAESIGLPYLDLLDVHPDEALVQRIPAFLARKKSCVPLMVDDDQLLVVSPFPIAPKVAEELHEQFGLTVRTVLCAPNVVNDLLNRHFSPARPDLAAGDTSRSANAPKPDDPAPAKSPASLAARRTDAAATALADLQAASRGDDDEQIAARAAVRALAKAEPTSAEVLQFRQMVAFAAFSIAATVFQTSYSIYAFVFFHPYRLSVFFLGWVVAAIIAGVTWSVTKLLSA